MDTISTLMEIQNIRSETDDEVVLKHSRYLLYI